MWPSNMIMVLILLYGSLEIYNRIQRSSEVKRQSINDGDYNTPKHEKNKRQSDCIMFDDEDINLNETDLINGTDNVLITNKTIIEVSTTTWIHSDKENSEKPIDILDTLKWSSTVSPDEIITNISNSERGKENKLLNVDSYRTTSKLIDTNKMQSQPSLEGNGTHISEANKITNYTMDMFDDGSLWEILNKTTIWNRSDEGRNITEQPGEVLRQDLEMVAYHSLTNTSIENTEYNNITTIFTANATENIDRIQSVKKLSNTFNTLDAMLSSQPHGNASEQKTTVGDVGTTAESTFETNINGSGQVHKIVEPGRSLTTSIYNLFTSGINGTYKSLINNITQYTGASIKTKAPYMANDIRKSLRAIIDMIKNSSNADIYERMTETTDMGRFNIYRKNTSQTAVNHSNASNYSINLTKNATFELLSRIYNLITIVPSVNATNS